MNWIKNSKRKRALTSGIAFFALAVLAIPMVHGNVTIEIAIGSVPEVSPGDVGILVADVDGDGFHVPQDGIALVKGGKLGFDDYILEVFQAESGEHWDGGVGFSGVATAIDVTALGIPLGTPLKFFWLPGKRPGEVTDEGEIWYSFRKDSVDGGNGGTIGFLAPDDYGVYRLSVLSTDLNGDLDSAGNDEYHSTGANLGIARGFTAEILDVSSVQLNWTGVSGATDYRVYRGTTDNISEATLLGAAPDITLTDSELTPGNFYYWVESVFPVNSSFAELSAPISTLLAVPDVTIGKNGDQLIGRDILTDHPSGQTYVSRTRRTRIGRGYSSVFNNGTGEGAFRLTGYRGNAYSKMRYIRTSPTVENVTGEIKTGAYRTSTLGQDSREIFRIDVIPSLRYRRLVKSRGRVRGSAKRVNVDLRAQPDENAFGDDRARLKVIRK